MPQIEPDRRQPASSRLARVTSPFIYFGEASIERPTSAILIVALLSALLSLGFIWLATDDALDGFLKSQTPDYQAFKVMEGRFPSSDNDLYVSVEGKRIFTSSHLRQLQDLSIELLLSEHVASAISILTLRKPLGKTGVPDTIIPGKIPDDPVRLTRLEQRILEHPLAKGRLLSPSGNGSQIALFVVQLRSDSIKKRGLPKIVSSLRTSIRLAGKDSDLKFGLSGIPVMTAEVIESASSDIVVFNTIGFMVGTLICFLFFRRWRLTLIANAPALLAILWCLGLFGWTGTKIDPLMNAVMPLVLVVAFNNAMHLLFSIRRNLANATCKADGIRTALLEVGPACALTSVTTSIALFSLAFSNSELIRTFGLMAGISVLLALNLVIVLLPLLAHYFLDARVDQETQVDQARRSQLLLDRTTQRISDFVTGAPRLIVITGTILTLLLALAYLQLKPRYILSAMLPDQGEARQVMKRTESRLGGLFPMNVMIEWPAGASLKSAAVKSIVAETHDLLAKHPKITKTNSFRDLQLWAQSGELVAEVASERLLKTLPKSILSRYVNEQKRTALVSGYIGDLEAKEILRIVQDLQPGLDLLKRKYPAFRITLTGLTTMSASRSVSIISQLSYSMIGAVAVVIAVIGFAFSSFRVAGLSTLPNLFALFATGSWLLIINGGLDYATIVGLTVGFGLAVDDTIHVLNRYQFELNHPVPNYSATERTLKLIGKVLILTTLVLLAGISVTQLSSMPPTRQFGLICMSTLVFALLADLVILPALIIWSERLGRHPMTRTLANWGRARH